MKDTSGWQPAHFSAPTYLFWLGSGGIGKGPQVRRASKNNNRFQEGLTCIGYPGDSFSPLPSDLLYPQVSFPTRGLAKSDSALHPQDRRFIKRGTVLGSALA